jgi:hypothetical protein
MGVSEFTLRKTQGRNSYDRVSMAIVCVSLSMMGGSASLSVSERCSFGIKYAVILKAGF